MRNQYLTRLRRPLLVKGEGDTGYSFSFSKEKVGLRLFCAFALLLAACTTHTAKNDADAPPVDTDTPATDDTGALDKEVGLFDEDVASDETLEDEDVAPDTDTHIGPGDKDPVEVDDDPWAGMLERVPFVWHNTKPEQSSDPDGIKELWYQLRIEEQWPLSECTPKIYDQCAENYPHEAVTRAPCEEAISAVLDPKILQNSYDYILTPYCWGTYPMEFPLYSLKGSRLSFYSSTASPYDAGDFVYDLDSRKLIRIGRGLAISPFSNGEYFFGGTTDFSTVWEEKYEEVPYYYHFVRKEYGKTWKMPQKLSYVRDIVASDQYLAMNLVPLTGNRHEPMRGYYTKIGEWDKWVELNFGTSPSYGIGQPGIQGSYLVSYNYIDNLLRVFFCDLAKGESSCRIVSKAGEIARKPIWGIENTFYYSVETGSEGATVYQATVEVTGDQETTVTSLPLFSSDKYLQVYQANEDFLLYLKYIKEGSPSDIYNLCYYRFSDKKHFCLEEGINSDIEYQDPYFYDQWIVFRSNRDLILRDMDAYCLEHSENCPFEGMK
ncbi:MAG TPA: hypothetical protein PLV42_11575 [bacterium]|nr:hypothetical protein [bacterium]